MIQLNEGLDYHDLKGQIEPVISIDEYKAKMGSDDKIVTIAFTLNSKLAAEDFVKWLERGYDYVQDAAVSEGEIEPNKWLVFLELNRRSSVPKRLIEILEDMTSLTDLEPKDYAIMVKDETYDADEDVLKQVLVLSPHEYREKVEDNTDLNEMRNIAGLNVKSDYDNDQDIQNLKTIAGL